MPYITKQEVKLKRDKIKKLFPRKDGWKFSITRRDYYSINLIILEAPIKLLEENQSYKVVTPGYINDCEGIKKDTLETIYNILNEGNFDKSDIMTDYHHVGFYVTMKIGDWDKDFIHHNI